MAEFGEGGPKPNRQEPSSFTSKAVDAVARYFGLREPAPKPIAETPREKKTIATSEDLPLRDVALMVASIEKPFTLDEITERFAEGHSMTPEGNQILRSRIYALGTIHAIQAEAIRDADGNFTSKWHRTDEGDKRLKDVIGIPNSNSQITPKTAN
jgi:hypothetical protein